MLCGIKVDQLGEKKIETPDLDIVTGCMYVPISTLRIEKKIFKLLDMGSVSCYLKMEQLEYLLDLQWVIKLK